MPTSIRSTPIVNINQVHLHEGGRYTTEASNLGWLPGQWHHAVTFKGEQLTRGDLETDGEGEIVGAKYRNASGTLSLMVFND